MKPLPAYCSHGAYAMHKTSPSTSLPPLHSPFHPLIYPPIPPILSSILPSLLPAIPPPCHPSSLPSLLPPIPTSIPFPAYRSHGAHAVCKTGQCWEIGFVPEYPTVTNPCKEMVNDSCFLKWTVNYLEEQVKKFTSDLHTKSLRSNVCIFYHFFYQRENELKCKTVLISKVTNFIEKIACRLVYIRSMIHAL